MKEKEWLNSAIASLEGSGGIGKETALYIQARPVRIGFREQNPSTGAYWTLCSNIQINPNIYDTNTSPDDPSVLSLIVHEVQHIRQGYLVALSVYGELEAWQIGYEYYKSLTGYYPHPLVSGICRLQLDWNRTVLQQARHLMQAFAGKGYRIDLLPLFPLHKELAFRLFGRI